MTTDNISSFSIKKNEKIIEKAIYDLDEWYDGLIDNDIHITTIIGILELVKTQLISETCGAVDDD